MHLVAQTWSENEAFIHPCISKDAFARRLHAEAGGSGCTEAAGAGDDAPCTLSCPSSLDLPGQDVVRAFCPLLRQLPLCRGA